MVGLLGENGAGKSTLMKILSGVYRADAGEILWEGRKVAFQSIQEAQHAGVSLIFQELNNCPNLKPVDNLFLGRELYRGRSGFLDYPAMRRKARELFEHLGVQVDLEAEVRRLSTAVQQMIEIGKALLTNVKLLVMDEPTSSLTDKETDRLFRVIRELKARGTSVVFISHKLNEVFEITDRIVVLRDGKNAGGLDPKQGNVDQLISPDGGPGHGLVRRRAPHHVTRRRGAAGRAPLRRPGARRRVHAAPGGDPGRGRADRVGADRDGAAPAGGRPEGAGAGADRGARRSTSGARGTRWRPGSASSPRTGRCRRWCCPCRSGRT